VAEDCLEAQQASKVEKGSKAAQGLKVGQGSKVDEEMPCNKAEHRSSGEACLFALSRNAGHIHRFCPYKSTARAPEEAAKGSNATSCQCISL